jgi:uncharacterized protein (DUF486 family)
MRIHSKGDFMQGLLTVLLLLVSNIFMTFAWYGHLRFRSAPLWEVILVSWLIAFAEYCFQVPANRIGSYEFSPAQLKVMQEVITLIVFGVFSVTYLKQQLQWNHVVAFVFIVGAVFFMFVGKTPPRISTGKQSRLDVSVSSYPTEPGNLLPSPAPAELVTHSGNQGYGYDSRPS